MKKQLKSKIFEVDFAKKEVVLHNEDAEDLGVRAGSRVRCFANKKSSVAIVNTTEKFVKRGTVGIFDEVERDLGLKNGDRLSLEPMQRPDSVKYVKKKLLGEKLTPEEIRHVVDEIVNGNMSEIEISAWVCALHSGGMDMDEVEVLTSAMTNTGEVLDFGTKTFDKHSVVYDTPILVKEDDTLRITEIGEFVDTIVENHESETFENTAEYVKLKENYEALAFDDDLKISFKGITGVYRHPAPEKLHKINLTGNRNVTVTGCHSLFVLKNGEVKSVPTKDIEVGDFIVVPRKRFQNPTPIKEISLIDELLKLSDDELDGIYITGVSDKFKREVPFAKRKYDLIPLKLLKEHKIEVPKGAKLKVSHGNALPTTIKVNCELMRILGYYISEGFANELGIFISPGTHETELIQDARDCIKKVFGLTPTLNKPHKTAVHICTYNKLLSKIFKQIFKCGNSALEKKIPEIVLSTSNELQLEFLRAYCKGDGYIRRGYESIFVTASEKLAVGLSYLLTMNGLSFTISKKDESIREFPRGTSITAPAYYIYSQARGLEGKDFDNNSFLNLVPIKEGGMIALSQTVKGLDYELYRKSLRQDYMRFESAKKILLLSKSDGNAAKLINGDVGFLQVKSIEEVKPTHKFVYDLCVEGYEKFLGGFGCIFLHNSIGGVPGNKISPLIIPIVASAGLKIPKTSSRAITSPAGAADVMEVFCPVDLNIEKIKEVVNKTNGCLVWGGSVCLAPADDLMIHAEYPLDLDPRPLLLASVMSKKKAVGADFVAIDIPVGYGTKVANIKEGEVLARDFISLGSRLGMKVECAITYGGQPVGHAIGPVLEAKEAYEALKHAEGPESLISKATQIAGMILEAGGVSPAGKGGAKALEILESGDAHRKFVEIVKAQGGKRIDEKRLMPGKHSFTMKAEKAGYVARVDNHLVKVCARLAGAPKDKGAGIMLHRKVGTKAAKGAKLLTVYAENRDKLELAKKFAKANKPIKIESMVLERIHGPIRVQ